MKREGRPGRRPTHRRVSYESSLLSAPVGLPLVYLRRAPLGQIHSATRCAWCASANASVHKTSVRFTMAPGSICDDTVACARRREIAGRLA